MLTKYIVLMKQVMLDLHAKLKFVLQKYYSMQKVNVTKRLQLVETTVGRAIIIVKLLPEGLPFELINQTMTKKAISKLINDCYRRLV